MSKKANESLRSNQRRAIEALLSGMTKGQAAAAAGVQPATLSRWLSEDDFQTVLREQGDRALQSAAVRLQGTLDEAVTVFRDVMVDEETSPAVRLRAADMVAGHTLKLMEITNLVERIEALEARL